VTTLILVVIVALGMGVGGTAEQGSFGLGGFMLGWLTLELAETNAVLSLAGYPTLGETVLVQGGGGSGGAAGGISLGGLGISGSTDAIQGGRSVGLEVGFSGVTVDLVTRPAQRLMVAAGLTLGKGSVALTARTRFAEDVEDALTSPTTTYLNASFFGAMATVRLRINVVGGIWLEGWAGYIVGFPGRWQDEDRPLAGPVVPTQGPVFGVGVSFGGFPSSPPAPVVEEQPTPERAHPGPEGEDTETEPQRPAPDHE